MRPGAAPPARRGRGPLGPTPRYAMIPRWGLVERFENAGEQQARPRSGPSVSMVRVTLVATAVVLGIAALAHVGRYVLLLINRSMLLNPIVAGVATWFGVLTSVLAAFAVVASAVVLTNWLIARRAAAFAHCGQPDPRPAWGLRLGCLVPGVNLVWAPVFVIELARVEQRLTWLRRLVVMWWVGWFVATVASAFSIATSFTVDAQGIADNTVAATIAYLLGAAALLLAGRVFQGFERTAVEHAAKRWVMVPAEPEQPEKAEQPDPATAIEPEQESAVPAPAS